MIIAFLLLLKCLTLSILVTKVVATLGKLLIDYESKITANVLNISQNKRIVLNIIACLSQKATIAKRNCIWFISGGRIITV